MRTFIAISLPPEIKKTLGELQAKLKQADADVAWVKPDNIHLTLKFLGEIKEKRLQRIMEIIDKTAASIPAFCGCIADIGYFPAEGPLRVIWAGLGQGDIQLRSLAAKLEEGIAQTGIPKEKRPFQSHCTLGRVRSPRNKEDLLELLKNSEGFLKGKKLEFPVGTITLFKSTLTSQGSIYEVLKETSLQSS